MRQLSIAVLVLVSCGAPGALCTEWSASEVVTSYVSGTSPTLILGFDNNLEICLALQEPRSLSDLRADGISFTDSQRVLLQLWNLVERVDDSGLRCTVPVIEPPVSGDIQTLAGVVANEVLQAAGDELDSYVKTVSEAGWPESRYTLIGSFVLDFLVWEALERLGAIESADASTLPSGSEYWSGVTWITLPPQPSRLGTDSHETEEGSLYEAWTPSSAASAAAVAVLESLRRPGIREELIALALGDLPAPPEHAQLLEELELVDDGQVGLPTIRAESRLCREGGELAMRVGRALLAAEGMEEIARLTGAESQSVAIIIAYHSVYPAILGRLEAGDLERPAVLAGEPGAPLAPALFVLEAGAPCVLIAD